MVEGEQGEEDEDDAPVMKKPAAKKVAKKPAAADEKAPPKPKSKSKPVQPNPKLPPVPKTKAKAKAKGSPKAKNTPKSKAKPTTPPKEEKGEDMEEEQPEEEQPREVDQEVDPSSSFQLAIPADTRDRSKSNKFKKLVADKALPDFVLKEWARTQSMTTGRLQAQRLLINQALDHDSNGKLVVALQKPYFKQLEEPPPFCTVTFTFGFFTFEGVQT